MKKMTKNLFLLGSVLLLALPESASALPGFARQTGKECSACHTQNMPKLNSYGRHFALSGYTLYDAESETESLIEGSEIALGLPAVLNVSAVLKARYLKTSLEGNTSEVVGAERGELQVFEGSGLYFGGRFAENFGGLVSLTGDPSRENDLVFGGKAILAYEALGGYSGAVLYSTQINGLFSGMENFNTGLNAPLKQFENPNVTNAAQATGIGRGPATGLQAYYGSDRFFVTAGVTIPSQNNEGIDAGASIIPFGRIAYSQPIGGWTFMIGAFGLSGDAKASDQSLDGGLIDRQANLVEVHKEGYGFDFEADGTIGDMMTMTTVNVVLKNVIEVTPDNLLVSANLQQTDNQAASLEFQINPITPFGIKAAYLKYNNRDTAVGQEFVRAYDFDAYSLALNYLLRQNILLDLQYSYNRPEPASMEDYYDFCLSAAFAF